MAKAEGETMDWKHLLAYITGTVDQELLLRGEASLRHALTQYVEDFHHERNHQGKGHACFSLWSAQAQRVKVQCSITNGLGGC
jgi:hypothetical protein